ncbi:MAG: RhuM family protein [Betaproteobacteria bacterium]|jgi:hypothetical protein
MAGGEFLLYQTEDGRTRVECRIADETLWLTQAGIGELFATTPQNVTQHLKVIFAEGELSAEATCKEDLQVRVEGGREVQRRVRYYRLEAILAVGYRVRSVRGTQFRRWATERLGEYLIKGFTLDDDRLKNPPAAGTAVPDYFAQLLERVRDIRASERRIYLRVREIFALAADYEPSLPETTQFFRIIQNKLHFAVTGQTAAELIARRADRAAPHMGLTSWRGGDVARADVTVAKNYLTEPEIAELNRIVVMWLDFAEDQALRRKQVFLRDWQTKLDEFLRFNERKVLPDAGSVSKKTADAMAVAEFEGYAKAKRQAREVLGAADAMKALEHAARALEAPPRQAGRAAAKPPARAAMPTQPAAKAPRKRASKTASTKKNA